MPIRLLLALTILVGCASTPPACPAAPAIAAGQPFLWKVHKQGGQGPTVWLFGTIHDAGLDEVPRAARDALASSTRFASELGDKEPDDRDKLRELMRIKSGPGLDQLLPTDDWWELRDVLRDVIREDELRRVRPWYALILLNRRSAPKVVSMDVELAKLARERKLDVDGLETWDVQLAALDSVVTVTDVQQALRARGGMRCEYVGLRAAYESGDLATMERLLVIPRTAEPILYERNRAWIPGIERYLASGGAFIAVGLGHMIGELGLPSLLARAGYEVERAK